MRDYCSLGKSSFAGRKKNYLFCRGEGVLPFKKRGWGKAGKEGRGTSFPFFLGGKEKDRARG